MLFLNCLRLYITGEFTPVVNLVRQINIVMFKFLHFIFMLIIEYVADDLFVLHFQNVRADIV